MMTAVQNAVRLGDIFAADIFQAFNSWHSSCSMKSAHRAFKPSKLFHLVYKDVVCRNVWSQSQVKVDENTFQGDLEVFEILMR